MIGFPQRSHNPRHARPSLFGCAYCPWPQGGSPGGTLACVFAWDPRLARPPARAWPARGGALQMCDWNGGAAAGHALADFVSFGEEATAWLRRAGALGSGAPWAVGQALAEASIDFFAERYGAPRGEWASLSWLSRGGMADPLLARAEMAKRLIGAQWEADELWRGSHRMGLPSADGRGRL